MKGDHGQGRLWFPRVDIGHHNATRGYEESGILESLKLMAHC